MSWRGALRIRQRLRRGVAGRRRREASGAGFTLLELIVTASLLLLLSGISISAAQESWRNEQTYAVAEELAGWLVMVQRAAMRGAGCDVSVAASSAVVSNGQILAEASQASGGRLTNSCGAFSPMSLESQLGAARFSISPAPLRFSFTPRGTIAASGGDPVVITVTNLAGGTARCVRLDGLLGITRLGVAEGGRCQT